MVGDDERPDRPVDLRERVSGRQKVRGRGAAICSAPLPTVVGMPKRLNAILFDERMVFGGVLAGDRRGAYSAQQVPRGFGKRGTTMELW